MKNLDSFLSIILNSSERDWKWIIDPYLPQLMTSKQYDQGFELKSHTSLLIFKPNISIMIAKGMPVSYKADLPWTECFSQKGNYQSYVDLIWNGMSIHRETSLTVDGCQCTLPLPSPGSMGVPQGRYDLFSLIYDMTESLSCDSPYHDYCSQVGLYPVMRTEAQSVAHGWAW